jgi:hypothetical protein
MMTSKFQMTRDISGQNGFGIKPSNTRNGVFLSPNVAQDLITLPTDQQNYIVYFSQTPGTDIFIDHTTTAAAYSGTAGAVTAEHNPDGRQYPAGTVLSVITPSAGGAYVEAEVFVIESYHN